MNSMIALFDMLKELRRFPIPSVYSNELRMLDSKDQKLVEKAIDRIAKKCKNDAKVLASVQLYLESK